MVILVRNISGIHVGIFEIVEFLNYDNISRNLCNEIKQVTKCWCKVKNVELIYFKIISEVLDLGWVSLLSTNHVPDIFRINNIQ
jgi:hypothetical protein